MMCVVPAMGPGGAERMVARLLEHLAPRHRLTLVTLEEAGTPSFYPLPDTAERIQIGLLGAGRGRLRRLIARPICLRALMRRLKPDVILSFLDTMNVTVVAAAYGLRIPVVVAERTDPVHAPLKAVQRRLRDLAYRLAPLLVVQSSRVAGYFPAATRAHTVIIPNPIPLDVPIAAPAQPAPGGRFRIIAVGRLSTEKRFGLLIDAFAEAGRNRPLWDLVIFGEGPERAALEQRAGSTGQGDRIRLPGLTDAVSEELAASHAAVLPSAFEGFPNALGEALAAGLPGVGYAGVSGVEEMIVPEKTGLLLPGPGDAASLASALARLMDDPALRADMGLRARDHMRCWDAAGILNRWEELLTAQAQSSPKRQRPGAAGHDH